jgi:hypothetical protein
VEGRERIKPKSPSDDLFPCKPLITDILFAIVDIIDYIPQIVVGLSTRP